jgi:hypothetical protein
MSRRRPRNRPSRTELPPPLSRRGDFIDQHGQHLGELGIDRAPASATFGWFGATIRVAPDLSELVMIDLMERGREIELMAGDDPTKVPPEAMTIIKDVLREFVHPDDFEAFWVAARRHGQNSQDLMTLTWRLLTKLTDRPTGQPSDSSAGLPETRATSAAGSLRTQAAPFIAEETQAGRPDRALQIVRAVEARELRTA